MKIRYIIIIISIFIIGIVLMIPMRAVSSYLNDIEDVAIEKSSGKWWSGELNNIYVGSNRIGTANISLHFLNILTGKLEFSVRVSGQEIDFQGRIGKSILGETSIKEAKFNIDVIKAFNKGKAIPQPISSLRGEILHLRFKKTKCISAEGSATAEVMDVLGIFRRNISVNSNIECKDKNLIVGFDSQEEGALSGEIIITPDLNYELTAKSENITSKIKELTKLRFNQTPSIKSSGSIIDLIEAL
tara:strand:+ start:7498 stop:8229 length:732 start_codon:yes stop_codon:yes gene_type:complete